MNQLHLPYKPSPCYPTVNLTPSHPPPKTRTALFYRKPQIGAQDGPHASSPLLQTTSVSSCRSTVFLSSQNVSRAAGRHRDLSIGTGDAPNLGAACWHWWLDIRPRVLGEDGLLTSKEIVGVVDWESIRKPVGNGILLILIALVWWRNSLGTDMQHQSWVVAVTLKVSPYANLYNIMLNSW